MRNIKFIIAYDGTDFSGWQFQPGQITVQGTLADVLEKLTQQRAAIHAAGRTDAGVHASGQVVNFKTESTMSVEAFQRAFNALLPPSIRVYEAQEVSLDFDSRWDAVAKTYRYHIFRGRAVPPFLWKYVYQDLSKLNFDHMAEAAEYFIGDHDFTTFAASTGSEEDDRERITTRTIYRSEFSHVPSIESLDGAELWIYTVRGRSFLRNMVRKMVGTLLEVGRGKRTRSSIPKLLALRDRSKSGPTAPPQGLCLESVEYAQPEDSPSTVDV
jgi:tRNA pseudouridine38-40 synthase